MAAFLGETPTDDTLVVGIANPIYIGGHRYRIGDELFALKINQMSETHWYEVEGVLVGTRYPNALTWITRIVGYYSFVKHRTGWGWNKSKIEELHDRRKGVYGVPGKLLDSNEIIQPNPNPVVIRMNHIRVVSDKEWRDRMASKRETRDVA